MLREEIADGALELVGVLAAGETAAAADRALCLRKLDAILAELSTEGAMFSRQVSETRNYAIGDAYVLLPTSREPAGSVTGTRLDDNGNDIPLGLYDEANWRLVPDKTATGTPASIYPAPDGRAYLYPVPDAAGSLTIYFTKKVPASEASRAPSLPDAWGLALQYGIALEVSVPFALAVEEQLNLERIWNRKRETLLARDVAPVPPTIEVDD